MTDKTLSTLFHDTLRDIYYAERKILKSLPKMKRAAQSDELKAAFEKHEAQTEGQIERLERVFEIIDKTPRGKTCDAINDCVGGTSPILTDDVDCTDDTCDEDLDQVESNNFVTKCSSYRVMLLYLRVV